MLPIVAQPTKPVSYVFTHFETSPEATGINSKPYAVILPILLSSYNLLGYDTAAQLTEETKKADRTGPIAILSSIGIVSIFGWAYYLALTFCIHVFFKSLGPFLPFFFFFLMYFSKDNLKMT